MSATTRPAAVETASDDHGAGQTETGSDAERVAAIETLVALAAKIEAARAGAESAGATNSETPVTVIMPRFICDPLEETNTSAGHRAPEMPSGHEERTPAELTVPSSVDHASRWTDVLRASYPEAGLLLVSVALLAALIYASAPNTRATLPGGPAVAKIRADEAAPPAAPAPDDARLKFVSSESCSGRPCESLLAFTPDPAATERAEPANGVSYTAAAQPDTVQGSTQANAPVVPDQPPSGAAPAQDVPAVVTATAGDAAPETEQIRTEPITSEPIKTEPVANTPIAPEQEPAPSKLEQPPDVAVAMPSALEIEPGDVSEAPAASAGIELSAPAQRLDTAAERPIEASPGKAPAATPAAIPPRQARPQKTTPAVRHAQQPRAAKKAAVATQSKPGGTKAALIKSGQGKPGPAKSAPKSSPGEKPATFAGAGANKAPGFAAPTPSALFNPAPPAPVASNTPEPAPNAGFAPGDKPPGFEIQTNLGGGFFAFAPY
jgi:hypothetical protein